MAHDLTSHDILEQGSLAPEMQTPPTNEGVGPQPLRVPGTGGSPFGDIMRAIAEFTATSGLARDPQSRQGIMQMVQRQRDQIRRKKIATEKQFFTSTLSSAWQSGDPKQIGKVMQQLSKLEGLEPESSEFADQIGLKVAQEVGQAAQEDELAEKLIQTYPEGSPEKEAIAGVIQSLPGMKPSQVMKILQSPLAGTKPSRQFVKELGGYVVSHGTGFWNPTGKEDEFIPLAGAEPKEKAESRIPVGTDREAISLELFNDQFSKLSGPERAIVNERAKKLQISIAGAKAFEAGVSREEVSERVAKLGEKSSKWVKFVGDRIITADPGKTEEAVVKAGFRPLKAGAQPQFVTASQTMLLTLNDLDRLIPKLFAKGGFAARLRNLGGLNVAWLRGDPDTVEFFNIINSTLPLRARAMAELGNLAKYEQEVQAASGVPSWSTQETANRAVSTLRRIYRRNVEATIGAPGEEAKGLKGTLLERYTID